MNHPHLKIQKGVWLIILLLFFIILSIFSTSNQPKDYPMYVSDSPSPTGVKGVYTYLKNEMDATRWTHAPELLPDRSGNLLIMVEPAFIPDKKELDAYVDFIRNGNTILLLKNNPEGMFDVTTEAMNMEFTEGNSVKLYDQNHQLFRAEIQSFSRLITKKEDVSLLTDESGTVAFKRNIGNGHLIVAVAPEWLINSKILTQDHLPIIQKLINESSTNTILLDEYLHNGNNAETFLTIYPKWLLLILFQGSLLLVLWLWLKGKRFGPILVPREDSVRFSDENIRALSAWYLRGRHYHDSLVIQADFVKHLLQEQWGIPYSRDWKDLTEPLEKRWKSISTSEISSFLNDLTRVIEKEKISKQTYLLWSRKLEQLRKEVETG